MCIILSFVHTHHVYIVFLVAADRGDIVFIRGGQYSRLRVAGGAFGCRPSYIRHRLLLHARIAQLPSAERRQKAS